MRAPFHPHSIVSVDAQPASGTVFFVDECLHDQRRVAMPRPEVYLVVRFGSAAHQGVDVHALGVRQRAYRKRIPRGQRALFARLPAGTAHPVFGVSATDLADRIVTLEALWGDRQAQALREQLVAARDTHEAAAILDRTIGERVARAEGARMYARLIAQTGALLAHASVAEAAGQLGISERHLRRIFREAIGIGPKTFARLTRFQRALDIAREHSTTNWADVAARAGYYDQAHLIAEYRAITGTTPRAFLAELRDADGN